MREINSDGTLKGCEFFKGYNPDAPPVYVEGDLIDYPCSPDWASYYASRGLTKDFPPEFYHQKNVLKGGVGKGGLLRGETGVHFAGRAELLHLQRKLNEHIDKAKASGLKWQE